MRFYQRHIACQQYNVGRVKILQTYPKYKEIANFYPIFSCILHCKLQTYVEQICHVLVTTLYNLNIACQHIQWNENLKYWEQTLNLKKVYAFISYFVYLGTFIVMSSGGIASLNDRSSIAC